VSTFKTQIALDQEQRSIRRDANPSARPLQQPLRIAKFSYSLVGTEAVSDLIVLGSLQTDGAVIIPELSRGYITNAAGTAAGTATLSARLERVSNGDDLTVTGALAARAALTPLTTRVTPTVDAGDYIQAVVTAISNVATDVLHLEIAYRTDKSAH
jgi:hypothetical protein